MTLDGETVFDSRWLLRDLRRLRLDKIAFFWAFALRLTMVAPKDDQAQSLTRLTVGATVDVAVLEKNSAGRSVGEPIRNIARLWRPNRRSGG